ncbi:MAG: 2-oxo acid dehydrogenase subunit E2 [Planctomycetaceae bacterium]
MPTEFKLPQLAEGVESADVADILIAEGDTITAGQIIMELETDKAVMELPCPHAGKVTKLLVKTGDTVKPGQPILTLEAAGAPAEVNGAKAAAPAAAKPAAASSAPASAPAKPQASAPAAVKSAPVAATAVVDNGLPIPAGPATRRLARELGVALNHLRGTGPGGRITQEDVARAYAGNNGSAGSSGAAAVAIPPLPDFSQFGPVERQAFSKLQRTAANNLSLAWQIIPHVTQHDLADVTEVEGVRRRFTEHAKDTPKVTMTAISMKAAVACLKEFPQFNASFDAAKGEVVLKKYYHIGVAVDTPTGLLVPVIRDVDQKTVLQLAAELAVIAQKARDRKLELKDMQGGTFTITNLGGIGGTAFTPIVNYPEVAILGLSRTQKQLQLVNGQVAERMMLPLSLSYDHRVINGADGARFLGKLCGLLTDSFRLLIEV